jgi:hypothetical protein
MKKGRHMFNAVVMLVIIIRVWQSADRISATMESVGKKAAGTLYSGFYLLLVIVIISVVICFVQNVLRLIIDWKEGDAELDAQVQRWLDIVDLAQLLLGHCYRIMFGAELALFGVIAVQLGMMQKNAWCAVLCIMFVLFGGYLIVGGCKALAASVRARMEQ